MISIGSIYHIEFPDNQGGIQKKEKGAGISLMRKRRRHAIAPELLQSGGPRILFKMDGLLVRLGRLLRRATINSRMGLNTWAAFFGTDANAEIAGDVAMLSPEVTPVLKALRANGLDVVAIHNHMISGQPTVYFLHYWGTEPAEKLAGGFKAALNELGKGGSAHAGN